ncbi:hypothetical protein WISP_140233 [Willisornis vidua]|uniref:Uncharacterized protein n=1 Tax=Willisornis vidua TaxID=1566151 RepID=A0ABQ9CMA8_9PASS|nr:hypothetical protein WISP_140233 [Willisornis vidua]
MCLCLSLASPSVSLCLSLSSPSVSLSLPSLRRLLAGGQEEMKNDYEINCSVSSEMQQTVAGKLHDYDFSFVNCTVWMWLGMLEASRF